MSAPQAEGGGPAEGRPARCAYDPPRVDDLGSVSGRTQVTGAGLT